MRALAPVAVAAALLVASASVSGGRAQSGAAPPAGYDPMARPAAPPAAAGRGGYDPLARGGKAVGAGPDSEVPLDPDAGNLPAGEGAMLVFAICAGCHSLDIVKQQHMSTARWDYTLDWMVREQGMVTLDDATRGTILSYLTQHFGSER